MSKPLWTPTKDIRGTAIERFRNHVNEKYKLGLKDYWDLHAWSVGNVASFWEEVWDWTGVVGERGKQTVDETIPMDSFPKWFSGSKINWAENMLSPHRLSTSPALTELSESLTPTVISYRDLYILVHRLFYYLHSNGFKQGDVLAYYGPTNAASAIALLACSALGGVFASCGSDMGVSGVVDRLKQVEPKILVVGKESVYAGKKFNLEKKGEEVGKLLGKTKVVHVDGIVWKEVTENKVEGEQDEIKWSRVEFNEPLWVLFSSGTTGPPKPIVHRVGGMILQSKKEHVIHGDIGKNDVFFYFTTPGWMMYNYLLSGLSTGASLILFDGSPLHDPSILWRLCSKFKVSVFGTSAKYLSVLSTSGYVPIKDSTLDLGPLKQILSTGSPLKAQLYEWVHENVKEDALIGSITGGTDICSLFCGYSTSLPVYAGEIQHANLGMAIESWNEEGKPVNRGESGELVCIKPFPAMPIRFWPTKDDPEGLKRYHAAYFEDFKGVWKHGDYCVVTEHGGLVMLGRSDAVLNPSGVRFGSAEIYEALETIGEKEGIEDSLAVGQPTDGGADERVVLFVVLKDGTAFDEEKVKRIKHTIRVERSPRHVPAVVLQVKDIPYTINGKKVEVPVKRLIRGGSIDTINLGTLRNPECLREYVELRDSQLRL